MNGTYPDSRRRSYRLPILVPFKFRIRYASYTSSQLASSSHHHDGFIGSLNKGRILSDLQYNSLPCLAVFVRSDGFISAFIPLEHSIDEESCLPVSGVTLIVTTARFDQLIIEIIRHLRFGITIDKPEEIAVVILYAVLRIVFLTQESRRLSVAIMWRSLDIEVLREIGTSLGTEVDTRWQIGKELGRLRFKFSAVSLRERRGIAYTVLVLHSDAELVIAERLQIAYVAHAASNAATCGKPVTIWQLAHLHQVGHGHSRPDRDGRLPREGKMSVHHTANDRTIR